MKKIVNRLVLACALAMGANAASAVTLSVVELQGYSIQGLQGVPDVAVPLDNIRVRLGAGYFEQDIIRLELVQPLSNPGDLTNALRLQGTAPGGAICSIPFFTASGNVIQFRVPSDETDCVANVTLSAVNGGPAVRVSAPSAILSQGIFAKVSAVSGGNPPPSAQCQLLPPNSPGCVPGPGPGDDKDLVGSGNEVQVARLRDQFFADVSTLNQFDGVVDVAKQRQRFTVADANPDLGGDLGDRAIVIITNDGVSPSPNLLLSPAAMNGYELDVIGDFGFLSSLDANANGVLTAAELGNAVDFVSGSGVGAVGVQPTSYTLNLGTDTLTAVFPAPAVQAFSTTMYVGLRNSTNARLASTEWSFALRIRYSNSLPQPVAITDPLVIRGATLGSWRINGLQVFIPYLPFFQPGSGNDVIVVMGNESALSTPIELDLIGENGVLYPTQSLGVLAARSTRTLQRALTDALVAAGAPLGTPGSQGARYALTLTTSIPLNEGGLAANYRIGENRVMVEVEDNAVGEGIRRK